MNIYLISQNEDNVGFDSYESAVVCAGTEAEARMTHPNSFEKTWDGGKTESWCGAKDAQVKLIGIAVEGMPKGVICSSYCGS